MDTSSLPPFVITFLGRAKKDGANGIYKAATNNPSKHTICFFRIFLEPAIPFFC